MSPETESEFEDVIRKNVKGSVNSLILDLRGNIGGDLTTSLTFLGLFSGPNEYAYDFFHRGEYQAQRTLGLGSMAELKKIREVAILTDGMTQSTAEVITAAMKRLHLGYSVGGKTRGWGSIEGQYPMTTTIDPTGQHEILLVVDLTVRDDTQPIEGNGVLPDVDTSVNGWQNQLSQHFFSSSLISAIKKQAAIPPQK
jgi:C-terminal processing protease CtpA/Prc